MNRDEILGNCLKWKLKGKHTGELSITLTNPINASSHVVSAPV